MKLPILPLLLPLLFTALGMAQPPGAPAGQHRPGPPPGAGPRKPLSSVKPTHADLAYANISPQQKLDLYLPTQAKAPFPVIVMIHGGAFMFGDKADGMGLAGVDSLLAAGYAVASINYRLSGEAAYPAQIFDAKTAVRFLRAHAKQYQLDPTRFGAWGASAGGNLAALLGTTGGVAALEGAELGHADQSSRVQAVVDWFGPIDFLTMQQQAGPDSRAAGTNDAHSPESRLVGAPIQSVPEKVALTNPTNFITADDAPCLIQHGTDDRNIPPIQGKLFAEALQKSLGETKVTYLTLDGAGHGGPAFETKENLLRVVDFFDQHLHQ
jgi:acetyl esterase/lipase